MTIYNLSSPPTIKMLSLRRRYCGMTALSRIKLNQAREMAMKSAVVYLLMTKFGADCQNLDIMKLVLIGCCFNYMSLMTPHPHLYMKLPKIVSKRRTIESFTDSEIVSYFRFRKKNQLKALILGFAFPSELYANNSSHKFMFMVTQLIVSQVYNDENAC